MSKGPKVLWTEHSVKDLEGIKEFISQDSVARAEKWVSELFNIGEGLSHHPMRGRIVPEFNEPDIRELLVENGLVA